MQWTKQYRKERGTPCAGKGTAKTFETEDAGRQKNINVIFNIQILIMNCEVLNEAPDALTPPTPTRHSPVVMALVRCPIVDYFTIVPIAPIYAEQLPGRATTTLPSWTPPV